MWMVRKDHFVPEQGGWLGVDVKGWIYRRTRMLQHAFPYKKYFIRRT
jgi:hypothetical protein